VPISSDGNDRLYGGDGNDTLYGGVGNDILDAGWGGGGVLVGGFGDDSMSTAPGSDIFHFDLVGAERQFGNDRILGFDANPSGGQDYIRLNGMSASEFSSQVHIGLSGGNTVVQFDGGGSITLAGVTGIGANSLTIGDFIFA